MAWLLDSAEPRLISSQLWYHPPPPVGEIEFLRSELWLYSEEDSMILIGFAWIDNGFGGAPRKNKPITRPGERCASGAGCSGVKLFGAGLKRFPQGVEAHHRAVRSIGCVGLRRTVH